jgi:hypothetical protein
MMPMENTAIDIGRVLEDDEQSTTENTRMRPYLDIWDVSTHFLIVICSWVKFSEHLKPHKNALPPSRRYKTFTLEGIYM